MFKNILILGLSCMMFACATGTKKTAKNLKVEDFFRNPEVAALKLSPDGLWIAGLRPYKNRLNLFVTKFDEKNWKRLTSYEDRGVKFVGWKGNDTLLYSKDFGGDENFHVFSVSMKTKEIKDLTPTQGERAYVIDDLYGVSEDSVLIASNRRLKNVSDVYKVNVETGKSKMVLKNPGNHTSWIADHKGVIRIAVSTDGVNNTYFYRDSDKKDFNKIKTLSFKDTITPLFFDFKNKNFYALTNVGWDKIVIAEMNPKTFKPVKVIFKNNNYDASDLSYSEKRKELISANYIDWKYRRQILSSYYSDIFNNLKTLIPNKEIYLTSHNKAEDLFTVYAGSDRSRGMYYTYNAKTKKIDELANPSPWLNEEALSETKPIKYKTRDGLTIEGYLTLPKDKKDQKNLPMVVNPHGGPWHRDVWGFNPEVQFLASRGYAVFQMNFRGSTGYGKKFWKASFKEWGKKMQNDITDGVMWLTEKEIADKDKICIYGGSYGGYATLAGLAFTPDLYKCGVDYVGVSNLFTFQETIPEYWKPYKKMLHEMVGHPVKDKKLLESASPYYHADKIKAALFVAQGANDPRVKKAESDQIVSALKKRGVEVEYMVKDDEGHGFHNEENRFEFYNKMENFIRESIVY